jgi:hypothetical protein
MDMEHRGVKFSVKLWEGVVPEQWRWIVYRTQPLGPTSLGQTFGSLEDAVTACENDIDRHLDQKSRYKIRGAVFRKMAGGT